MFSVETIQALQLSAARQAAHEHRIPFIWEAEDNRQALLTLNKSRVPSFPFPNLGNYVPPDWESTGRYWQVDKSGHFDGLSLGAKELLAVLVIGLAYAITEEGPFQCIISEFCTPGSVHLVPAEPNRQLAFTFTN